MNKKLLVLFSFLTFSSCIFAQTDPVMKRSKDEPDLKPWNLEQRIDYRRRLIGEIPKVEHYEDKPIGCNCEEKDIERHGVYEHGGNVLEFRSCKCTEREVYAKPEYTRSFRPTRMASCLFDKGWNVSNKNSNHEHVDPDQKSSAGFVGAAWALFNFFFKK